MFEACEQAVCVARERRVAASAQASKQLFVVRSAVEVTEARLHAARSRDRELAAAADADTKRFFFFF